MDKHEINFKLDSENASLLTLAIGFYTARVRQMTENKTLTYHEDHLDWLKKLRQMQDDLRRAIIRAEREGGTS